MLQEQPRPLIFLLCSAPFQAFPMPHGTCMCGSTPKALIATAAVMSMPLCHASVMPASCP
jgi:hypothetical protein